MEILEELLKLDPGAKVVILTAVEQEELDRQLANRGVSGVIRKPFFLRGIQGGGRRHSAETGSMSENANEILSRIAVASLQKCTEKLSRVSAGGLEDRRRQCIHGDAGYAHEALQR